eukprot:TRINITY_DN18361_c0_g1_i1.p1 TRINITY_DN18361_c0_g1~~TRINITY_DN18361_c0_g1_i1.p1  ORF type:complete len:184 (+),score=23.19 TRINITY_DN18361_c0_g1_i1:50-553(+)
MRILVILALVVAVSGQSAAEMASHIEKMVEENEVTRNCSACSAVIESVYNIIAWGEGHHVNDAGVLYPRILEHAASTFFYDSKKGRFMRAKTDPTRPNPEMKQYISDVVDTHYLMTILSPYVLQNDRHGLHELLCVTLLKHCADPFVLPMHPNDIHEDYDRDRLGQL